MTILAHTGKGSMIVSFAAVVLAVGLTSGLVYFEPTFARTWSGSLRSIAKRATSPVCRQAVERVASCPGLASRLRAVSHFLHPQHNPKSSDHDHLKRRKR